MNMKAIIQKLHSHGLRTTPQRIWVYDYICTNRTHPDADEIYEALLQSGYSATRATVYNVLQALTEKGLLIEIKADGTRTRYDANVELHGHFLCSVCNKIYDFGIKSLEYEGIDGFETLQRDVYFGGVCNKCKNN